MAIRNHRFATTKLSSDRGFTLIELLAVMMIIGIMATAVTTAYVGMMRGSGMREAVNQLRSCMILARQKAITDGNKVALFFRKNTSLGIVQYYIVQAAGTTTDGTGDITLKDEFNPELIYMKRDAVLFRMDNANSAKVETVVDDGGGQAHVNFVQSDAGVFTGAGLRYGVMLHTECALPRGFRFKEEDDTNGMNMYFYPDGSVLSGNGSAPAPISIYEEIDPDERVVTLTMSAYGTLSTKESYE